MQARFIHDGNAIDYRPDSDVAAGDVVVQEQLVGIAKIDIPAGTLGALAVTGVFEIPKEPALRIMSGQEVYWDEAAGHVRLEAETGANKYIGKAVADSLDTEATVQVRLRQ